MYIYLHIHINVYIHIYIVIRPGGEPMAFSNWLLITTVL